MPKVKISGVYEKYDFLLFVTGMSITSIRAIENIKTLCEKYLKNRYTLQVIDIYKNPAETEKHNIIASPTLVKKSPAPFKHLIGDLSDKEKVLAGIGIK